MYFNKNVLQETVKKQLHKESLKPVQALAEEILQRNNDLKILIH